MRGVGSAQSREREAVLGGGGREEGGNLAGQEPEKRSGRAGVGWGLWGLGGPLGAASEEKEERKLGGRGSVFNLGSIKRKAPLTSTLNYV